MEDNEILAEESAPKPILPENFDERGTREKIRSKALKIRRRPGKTLILSNYPVTW